MADILSITQAIGLVAGFALVVALAFFLKGLYLIRAGEVGVLVKRLGGRKMPAGEGLARHRGTRAPGAAAGPRLRRGEARGWRRRPPHRVPACPSGRPNPSRAARPPWS